MNSTLNKQPPTTDSSDAAHQSYSSTRAPSLESSPNTGSESETRPHEGNSHAARWIDAFAISPSITLENSGSVARDHLASERTFLAYVRTSLAISSAGVAIVQLFLISNPVTSNVQTYARKFGRPLGAVLVCLGLFVLFTGLFRYFAVQKALTKGVFPAARRIVVILTAALAAVIAIVFAILVAGK